MLCATNQNLAYAKGYTSVFILTPSRYPPWLFYKQAVLHLDAAHKEIIDDIDLVVITNLTREGINQIPIGEN